MDIPLTTYNLLNEKLNKLSDESVFYELVDRVGAVAHVRGPCLDLPVVLQTLPATTSTARQQFEVYADVLLSSSQWVLPSTVDSLVVFARKPFPGSDQKAVRVRINGELLIQIYTLLPQPPINFELELPNGTVIKYQLLFGDADYASGFTVKMNGTVEFESDPDPPIDFLNTMSLSDQVMDNGTLANIGIDRVNDNLRKLLTYQLLLATVLQDRDPTNAYSLAAFVSRLTHGVPSALDLFSRASTFAAGYVASSSTALVPLVPMLDISATKQVLKSRLTAALAYETAFQSFKRQEGDSADKRMFATIALDASEDAEKTFAFMTDLAQTRHNSAQQALDIARGHLQDLELEIPVKQQAFKDGIDKWKKDETLKVVGEALVAIAVVGGSVAAACVFPPAGAAGIATATATFPELALAIAKGVPLIQKVLKIIETLKALVEKLKPGLEKIGKIIDSIKSLLALLASLKDVNSAESGALGKLKMPLSSGDDTINLTADWDVFALQMSSLFEEVREHKINGAQDFFLLMGDLAIRGKAVLAAQLAVVSTGDALFTVLTQSLAAHNQTARLRAAIPLIHGNPAILRLVKLNMFERLLALRAWLVLDFRQYVQAYGWYALESVSPITLDPMKEIEAFAADAATLQASVVQARASVHSQTQRFVFRTADATSPVKLIGDLSSAISKDRTVHLSIDESHPVFSGLARIRLQGFRVFLDGLSNSSDRLAMTISLGNQMRDLALGPLTILQHQSRVLQYVTSATRFGFCYSPSTGEVLMEARLRDETSCMAGSPFRDWTISIEGDVALDQVKGLRVELECEVTMAGQY